jgi:stearoyl-CoA desaturase (Delta-9 desaturase)
MNSTPRHTVSSERLQAMQRRRALAFNLIPALGFALALCTLAWRRPTRVELVLLAITYVLAFIGVEIGFHRYFSHNAFRTGRVLRAILGVLGSTAAQGPVTYWVSNHRRHHKYADRPDDPHSPHVRGSEKLLGVRGLWHAHVGWILRAEITNTAVFARDLIADRDIVRINRFYLLWVIAGIFVPAAVAGAVSGSWNALLYATLWTGLVRVFLVQHATFAVNSICHKYGRRPFGGAGTATNNAWLALPTLGGSWHHNHHAFPRTADNALEAWQLDPGAWVIDLLELAGVICDVYRPSAEQVRARQLGASNELDETREP